MKSSNIIIIYITAKCELQNQIFPFARVQCACKKAPETCMRCACEKAFKMCLQCACVRPFFGCATCDCNFARFGVKKGPNVDFFRLNKPHSYLEKVTMLNRRFLRRDTFYHDLLEKIFVENIHNNLKIPFIIPPSCTISNHVSTFVRGGHQMWFLFDFQL